MSAPQPNPTFEPVPLPRVREFESLGYGLFLHWGLYSLVGAGEWALKHRSIPQERYRTLMQQFTAADWKPRELVRFARRVGFRYVCLTARHHDGFSLYDTRGLSDWDAPHSAVGRDLVAEFADACHGEGVKMFLYHTTLDWQHPAFDGTKPGDWERYLEYLNASVEILATEYGPVAGFWFDGKWSRRERDWNEGALYAVCRRHQPDCIIVNNLGKHARGKASHPEVDVVTFEQGRPKKLRRRGRDKYVAAEMNDTVGSHWGIATRDFSQKGPGEIINTLAACRRHGANLLLNVGPTAGGALPAYEAALLEVVGRWISTCAGRWLYTARPAELQARGSDFVLRDGTDFYYFLHHLPTRGNSQLPTGESGSGLKTVGGLRIPVREVRWTDNNERLAFSQDVDRGMLTFRATEHPYGEQFVVRVARIAAQG
jgi:alpha-L-fucosidase